MDTFFVDVEFVQCCDIFAPGDTPDEVLDNAELEAYNYLDLEDTFDVSTLFSYEFYCDGYSVLDELDTYSFEDKDNNVLVKGYYNDTVEIQAKSAEDAVNIAKRGILDEHFLYVIIENLSKIVLEHEGITREN